MYDAHLGALIGAGIGALAGQLIGGDTEATLAGAGLGAIAGYLIRDGRLSGQRLLAQRSRSGDLTGGPAEAFGSQQNGASGTMAAWLTRILAFGDGRGRWFAHGSSLVLLVMILVQMQIITIPAHHEVDSEQIRSNEGLAYTYRISIPGSDEEGVSSLRILEDGHRLWEAHARHAEIREKGAGRFSHKKGVIYFSSLDASDPRTNGRRYVLAYAWVPPILIWGAALAAFLALNLSRIDRLIARSSRVNPGWLALGIVLLAGSYRLAIAWDQWYATFSTVMLKGVPYTDAHGWDLLASAFAYGERWEANWAGWSARRPFYYVFMGSFGALFGPSVTTARVIHLLLGTLSAALIFDLVRRLSSRPVAIVAALLHAFHWTAVMYALTTMTEALGSFLTVASTWFFVYGAARMICSGDNRAACGRAWWWPFLLAGVTLGLCNLTRTVNLGAVLLWPIALAMIVHRAHGRQILVRVVSASLVFVCGVVVALAPWIARQRVVHGIYNISDNSSQAFFAATSPEFRTWSSRVKSVPPREVMADIRARTEFFNERIAENLKEHFWWYLGHAASYFRHDAKALRPPLWITMATAMAAFCGLLGGCRSSPGRLAWLGATCAAVCLVKYGVPWIWIAGAVYALIRRDPLSLLAAMLLATLGALGLGAISNPRLTYHLLWMCGGVEAWLVLRVLWGLNRGHPYGWASQETEGDRRGWGVAGRAVKWAAVGAVVLLMAGASVAAYRNLVTPRPLLIAPTAEEARAAIRQTLAGEAYEAYDPIADKLTVVRVRLWRDYIIRLEEGERISHRAGFVKVARPFACTVFGFRPIAGGGFAVFPGHLPDELVREEAVVNMVGRWIRYFNETTFEAIAVEVPGRSPETKQLLRVNPGVVPAHARFMQTLLEGGPAP